MTSSLAKSKQIIGGHFLDAFSAIFLSFGVPQYLNRLDYIKACDQQFTLKPKKSLHITFKTRLDKFWSNQDVLYNFKAPFLGTGSRSYLWCGCMFILLRI